MYVAQQSMHCGTCLDAMLLLLLPPAASVLSGPAAAGSKDDWGGMPWKPWDREKDLNAPASKPRGASDLLKAAGSLSNRFSSGR